MGDCPTPTECSILIGILGARCERCFRRDPDIESKVALLRAKADAKPATMKAPRHRAARGLHDAQRARTATKGTGRGRTLS